MATADKVEEKMQEEEDDLEDGEIETDDENEEETKVVPEKKESANNTDFTRPKSTTSINSTNKEKSSNNSKKNKLAPEDDWATNVENAIAKELWKDGVEPPQPTSTHHHHASNNSKSENRYSDEDNIDLKKSKSSSSSSSKSKKRRKDDRSWEKLLETQKKKQKLKFKRNSTDDVDLESEMLLMRGGSPSAHPPSDMDTERRSNYETDCSTGSSYSMDSAELDRLSYEGRKRRRNDRYSRNNDRSSSNRNRSDTNRRSRNSRNTGNDRYLDDEVCVRFLEGKCHSDNCPRIHTLQHSTNSRIPKKMELCKFYLMECCAKREKCLYMHSDFPCKYYYLGLTCQNKDTTCKFAHGKPLTDELKQILLKHLETAPKEILGDFPRISRERALNLITTTHIKLCKEYGIELPNTGPTGAAGGNGSGLGMNNKKIPSLLEVVISNPISNRDREKPRKSRWCDTANAGLNPNNHNNSSSNNNNNNSNPALLDNFFKAKGLTPNSVGDSVLSAGSNTKAASPESDDILSIKNLSGVITPEQIEQLTAIGINNINEMSNLTVAQLNHVGLTALQINEIQLNTLNMKKLGLTNNNANANDQAKVLGYTNAAAPSLVSPTGMPSGTSSCHVASALDEIIKNEIAKIEKPNTVDNLFTGQDLDMRTSNTTNSTKSTSLSNPLSIGYDVDMRFIDPNTKSSNEICEIKSPDHHFPSNTGVAESSNSNSSIVDFSQYLKDSNIKTTGDKGDDGKDMLLLFDASWGANNDNNDDDDDDSDDENRLKVDDESFMENTNEDSNDSNTEKVEPEKVSESKIDEEKDETEKDSNSSENVAKKNIQNDFLLPAIIDTNSVLNTNRLSKIDLSTSVAKLLNKSEAMDMEIKKPQLEPEEDKLKEKSSSLISGSETPAYAASCMPSSLASTRDPRTAAMFASINVRPSDPRQQQPVLSFSTSKPAVSSDSEYFDMVTDVQNNIKMRSSIYDSDVLDTNNSDDEAGHSRKPDKDMRLTSYMMSADGSNGDVDLRFPFKPIMTHYIPATEIDCSINSHAPIPYKVHEIDVPKPDYKDIRKSFQSLTQENKRDPRLRRIFGLKESDTEEQQNSGDDMFTIASPTIASPPHLTAGSSSAAATSIGMSSTIQPMHQQRVDPRRKKDNLLSQNPLFPLNPPLQQMPSESIEMQTIIQKSDWYANLSSKQKIFVNQNLAMLTQELKSYHNECCINPDSDKLFNLNFITSNPVLQQILESLGYSVDQSGKFVECNKHDMDSMSGNMALMGNTLNSMGGYSNVAQHLRFPQGPQLGMPAANNMGLLDFLNMNNRLAQQINFAGNMNQRPPSLLNDMNNMLSDSSLHCINSSQHLTDNNFDNMIPPHFMEQNMNFNTNSNSNANNNNSNPYFGDNRNNNRGIFRNNTSNNNNNNNNSNRNERWNQRGRNNNNNNDMRSRRGNNNNRNNDNRNRREKSKN